MFNKSAELYDLIYSFKNYATESAQVHKFIKEKKESAGNALLDIACGTGHHIQFLKRSYAVEGLDLDEELLDVARQRNPDVPFHLGNMIDFRLEKRFDGIICLFSAIGYVQTAANLERAIANMADHLQPGGVLLIEPWLTPETYTPDQPFAIHVDQPGIKISRMNVSKVEHGASVLDFHYLVATESGVRYFTEQHRLGLFSKEQHIQAFRKAGLQVSYHDDGLMGRGLYVGLKALRSSAR